MVRNRYGHCPLLRAEICLNVSGLNFLLFTNDVLLSF